MKENKLIPIGLFIVIAVVYTLPILKNFTYWGQMDWDQFTFWNAVPRETFLTHFQFPLWNPYSNGGNVLLAHPHSPFLSPMYLFVLFFGPVIGLKLEIIIHLIIGLLGMFKLSRYLKLDQCPAYLSSFVFMLNSMYALHLTEGHAEWLPMAFVPWAFLYYLKSMDHFKNVIGVIIFLSLMILAGSVDVFTIFILFLPIYALCQIVQSRNFVPLKILSMAFMGVFFSMCNKTTSYV